MLKLGGLSVHTNKTGLQPISKPVEQILVFSKIFIKLPWKRCYHKSLSLDTERGKAWKSMKMVQRMLHKNLVDS